MPAYLDEFTQEIHCVYKNERYSVRDNGFVLRHPHDGKRPRPYDEQWTLGRLNPKTGYRELASVRIHRIVATAFHGEPPSGQYVVDHIDTNKQNNRPENLRWVTRLENILLNPITAKRIAQVCGSVEAFLADPYQFRDKFEETNYAWMRTVSVEEAKVSLQRMLAWAADSTASYGGDLGEWIFRRSLPRQDAVSRPEEGELIVSKTVNAVQRNWRIPSEFPCCPLMAGRLPLEDYARNLKPDSVFCRNDVYSSLVSKHALSEDGQSLCVLSKSTGDPVKPWVLARVMHENKLFVHVSLGSFFSEEGAEKEFALAQGLDWTGGLSIDDFN